MHWIATKEKPRLGKLLEHLEEVFSAKRMPFVEGCLKCSIGVGAITIKGNAADGPDRLIVGLSEHSRTDERAANYAAGFADELETQAKRVEFLIRHWPTVGTFREELFRDLLQKSLPERYRVATGFVYGYSRQLDIIIYDCIDNAPLFREGNLVVVHLSAVRAVIEVKSTLNHEQLRNALEILHPIDDLTGVHPPIFKGVFAFTSQMSTAGILGVMTNFYSDTEDLESNRALTSLTEIVTAVCVQKHTLILSDFEEIDGNGGMIVPTFFSVENILGRTPQAALFFDNLNLHVRGAAAVVLPRFEWGALIEAELERGEERNVYEEAWGPYIAEMYDGSYDGSEVRAKAEAIKRWRLGGSWSPPRHEL